MDEHELEKIKELFLKLNELVSEYGGNIYRIQSEIMRNIIECIDSDMEIKEKKLYVLRNYKNLYPKQGALSDFYIWHDNYEERLRLNKPLDEINDALWEILKKYI